MLPRSLVLSSLRDFWWAVPTLHSVVPPGLSGVLVASGPRHEWRGYFHSSLRDYLAGSAHPASCEPWASSPRGPSRCAAFSPLVNPRGLKPAARWVFHVPGDFFILHSAIRNPQSEIRNLKSEIHIHPPPSAANTSFARQRSKARRSSLRLFSEALGRWRIRIATIWSHAESCRRSRS